MAGMKVLMVCLGNICRSPLAEGIFRRVAERRGLDWEVDSAGTSGWHAGELPDRRSIQIARHHGLDIAGQRSRQVTPQDLFEFDYVFAMDASNLRNLTELAMARKPHARVVRFLEFAGYKDGHDVPDPYYNDQGFREVFDMLESASPAVIDRILLEQRQSLSVPTPGGIAFDR